MMVRGLGNFMCYLERDSPFFANIHGIPCKLNGTILLHYLTVTLANLRA